MIPRHFQALGRLKPGDVQACTHCQVVKPLSDFYTHTKKGKERVHRHCKACQYIKTKAWLAANADRARELNSASKARNHEAVMARQRALRAELGHQPEGQEAKARRSARQKAKRSDEAFIAAEKANSKVWISDPKNRARYNAWQANRRARQRNAEGSFLADEWIALCERAGWRCLRCLSGGALTVDHVLPLSLGGSNAIGNIQPLCGPCNSSKGATHADYRNGLHE